MTVHDFKAKTIDGKEQSLAEYSGKVLLVVNVASQCGLTPVNGSTVSPGVDIATMSSGPMQIANKVKWTELAVGNSISLSMDFQAADDGTFNDDRLGMMNDFDSTTSDRIFGAQLEGHHIESYFNRYGSDSLRFTP